MNANKIYNIGAAITISLILVYIFYFILEMSSVSKGHDFNYASHAFFTELKILLHDLKNTIFILMGCIVFLGPPVWVRLMPTRLWLISFNLTFFTFLGLFYLYATAPGTEAGLGAALGLYFLLLYMMFIIPITALSSLIRMRQIKYAPHSYNKQILWSGFVAYILCAGCFLIL